MFLYQRLVVGEHTRILVTKHGRFDSILGPGKYRLFGLGFDTEVHSTHETTYSGLWVNYLLHERPDVVRQFFDVVETGDPDVAVVSIDARVRQVVGSGRRVLFWKGAAKLTARVFNARESVEIPSELVGPLGRFGPGVPMVSAQVEEGKTGLLFVDGTFVRALPAGAYGFWNVSGAVRVDVIDLRLQTIEIPGQEILTRDKVGVRVNVWAEYRVLDAVKAKQSVKDYADLLYRSLQLGVRQTLGKRSLDEVLAERADIDPSVAAAIREEMAAIGIAVGAIALKDVILPGDVREILNQVVVAEKQAQANLIRRREETAATRSLLNTARLLEENPLLVRLKELETLERVAEKVETIHVGGFDQLLERVITLRK